MKKNISHKIFLIILFLFSFNFLTCSMLIATAQNSTKGADTGVSFPNLYTPTVDFQLNLTGNKKFKVVLEPKTMAVTKIKVYDILGNLIVEDKIVPEDGKTKAYDFSHINSHLFVVEVGNSKYNRTKSIYAQPSGTRLESVEAEKSED